MRIRRSRRCRVSGRGSRLRSAVRPTVRAHNRSAAIARMGRSSSRGMTMASGWSGRKSASRSRSSPPSPRMIACRPSKPPYSATSVPRLAGSIGRAPIKLAGAGARRTMVGSTSARQKIVVWWAGSRGSTGKAEPPTPDEGIPLGSLGGGVGGGLTRDRVVVFLIGRVAAQEFPRETGPIELTQVVVSAQRPPVGGR